MVNIKHNRIFLNRDKFQNAMDDIGMNITKLASLLYVSNSTIHYRINNGWKRLDAEIVAKFLRVKLSKLI